MPLLLIVVVVAALIANLITAPKVNAADPATQPVTSAKPEEYHVVDPSVAGFQLRLTLRDITVNSLQEVSDGTISKAFLVDSDQPGVGGPEFPLELASDDLTDGIIKTAKFGNIKLKVNSNGYITEFSMTDSEVAAVKKFLASTHAK